MEKFQIRHCQFIDINCTETMFYDASDNTHPKAIRHNIIDIIEGGFYASQHSDVNYIDIFNISIKSKQMNTNVNAVIFNFASGEIANMSSISVLYGYDISANCEYDAVISNTIINASCSYFNCKNPVIFSNLLLSMIFK